MDCTGIFKNLYPIRIAPTRMDPGALADNLAKTPFRPCGSQEPVSRGWVAPFGDNVMKRVRSVGGYWLICLQTEEKLLPASVIRAAVDERVAAIEASESRKVRSKEKNALKDEVMLDLLPRAFTRRKRMYAYIDPRGGWLIINGTPGKAAEEFISLLHKAAGSLFIEQLRTKRMPYIALTNWLADTPPDGWKIGDRATLRDLDESGDVWSASSADLSSDYTHAHLDADQAVTRLAVEWRSRLSCVLCEDCTVRRLRFSDVVLESLADTKTETIAEEMDARFALMTLELSAFLPEMVNVFGGVEDYGART